MDAAALSSAFEAAVANVCRVLFGRQDVVRLALCCLIADGHLLVEDLPGVGKTTLAKALARSVGIGFRRVQFTADMLPADVTGAVVYDRESSELTFRPGPIFTNVLLADELNRASPKAQSALLEAMEEHQVSADGITRPLPLPFMVIATQNPFDAAGTYPLPHSQRDRFLIRVALGYPPREAEDHLLANAPTRPAVDSLEAVWGTEMLAAMNQAVSRVHVEPAIRSYVLDIVTATRAHPDISVGASPRAALALLRAGSAVAVAKGRTFLTPDDIKVVATYVLAHRLLASPAAERAGVGADDVVRDLLGRVGVPVARRNPAG